VRHFIRRPDGLQRAVLAAVGSVTFLIVLGYTMLLFTRVSDLDRKCLDKSLSEMQNCINEYYRSK